jgi:CHAT domain-containing protein
LEKNLFSYNLRIKKYCKMLKKTVFFFILFTITTPFLKAVNQHFKSDSIRSRESLNAGIDLARKFFLKEAIDSFQISLEIRKKTFGEKSIDVGIVHNALGINYRNLGQIDKSLEHFFLAEKCYKSEYDDNKIRIANLYNNIGNSYLNNFDFIKALDFYQRAIELLKSDINIATKEGIADIYYNVANIYFLTGNNNKALEIIGEYQEDAYADTRLFFLSLKAAIFQTQNRTEEATKAYMQAIRYAERIYSITDIYVAFEYLNFATFLISSGETEKAAEILVKAREIIVLTEKETGTNLAEYHFILGNLHAGKKVETNDFNAFREQKSSNLTEAIRSYQKGLKALGVDTERLSGSDTSLENVLSLTQSLDLLKLIADTYTQIADIYSDTRHPRRTESIYKALDYYEITSNLIQQARKEIYSDENKIQLSELEEATFHNIIQAAYKAYEMDGKPEVAGFAFENAERMKASSVFDRLSDQLAKENSLIPDSLTNLERTLNFSITSHTEKLYNLRRSENADRKDINETDSILFQLKRQRDELSQYLEKNYSDYYDLKYAGHTIHFDELQKNIRSNEVLIEYVLNETHPAPELYAFFISSGSKGFYKIDIDSTFIGSIETSFRFMSNPAYLFTRNENSKNFCTAACHLYQKLIQPFESEIQDKKLTIIPDGKLSYIPFDALLTEMPDTTGQIQFNQLPYLIRNTTVNYAYSANLLFKFNRQKRKAKNRIIAFAPEYQSDTIVFENEKLILVPLPGVQKEVDIISKEINTRLFRGDEATEQNFRNYSQNHDILHLAMHAFINDSLPAFSRFAFAQNNTSAADNDGWLNTADIYNFDLDARLTVLSACNTGSGSLRKGEGVMSLARGFLYAGCPTIVMTLWEVEDNAGTKIMSSFYHNLKKGRTTDESLRLAKLKYLEEANLRMAHPHYWLGYVGIGSAQTLFRSYDYYFMGLVILALLIITADQFIRMKKARKRRYKK